jgi:hypothetical protein
MKKILPLFLLLAGCSVIAHNPMNRFESPETRGEGWEVQVGAQSRNEIELTPDFVVAAPSHSSPSINSPTHALFAQGAVGLGRNFDLSLSALESRIGGKLQVLGAPASEAEAGNFPISIRGGFGWDGSTDSDFFNLGSNNRVERRNEIREIRGDIGLILGYRTSKHILIYGGPFAMWNLIKTKYSPNTAGSTTIEAESTARSLGFNVGIQGEFADNFFMRLEAAGTKTKMGNADVGRADYGLAGGMYF